MSFLSGRINRAGYWLGVATLVLCVVVARFLFHATAPVSEILLIFLAVPRLHDLGRSGWHVLWGVAVEVAAVGVGIALGSADAVAMAGGVAALILMVLMAVLGAIPGQATANRFGKPPRPGLERARRR